VLFVAFAVKKNTKEVHHEVHEEHEEIKFVDDASLKMIVY
jgi:hypothetical protein